MKKEDLLLLLGIGFMMARPEGPTPFLVLLFLIALYPVGSTTLQ
jgi:hypothetical protein